MHKCQCIRNNEFIKEEDSDEESYAAYAVRHVWAEDGNGIADMMGSMFGGYVYYAYA